MNPKLISVALFLILIVAVVPLVMRLRAGAVPDPVTLKELDAGSGRSVRITVEPNSQRTLSLHYHVDHPGQPPVEHAFFGTLPRTSPPPDFVTYTADDGDLIGIAQASVPNRIIILHDFASGDSWPLRIVTYKDTDPRHLYPYYEGEEQIMARGEAMFARLSDAHPDSSLELLRTMSSRPLTIPTGQTQSPPQPHPGPATDP